MFHREDSSKEVCHARAEISVPLWARKQETKTLSFVSTRRVFNDASPLHSTQIKYIPDRLIQDQPSPYHCIIDMLNSTHQLPRSQDPKRRGEHSAASAAIPSPRKACLRTECLSPPDEPILAVDGPLEPESVATRYGIGALTGEVRAAVVRPGSRTPPVGEAGLSAWFILSYLSLSSSQTQLIHLFPSEGRVILIHITHPIICSAYRIATRIFSVRTYSNFRSIQYLADMAAPENLEESKMPSVESASDEHPEELINASGHRQEVQRNFSLISICAVSITTGNTWIAQGGSVTTALSNGGPAFVIYEFIAVSVCYWLVAASIAELASGMPSASGVYHWASITAGKYGRICGFFAGFWNFLAWTLGAASMASILGQQTVSMYALMHPGFVPQTWHSFVSFIICSWLCCCIVLFMNRILPLIGNMGGFFILAGVFVTIIVCAVMPHVNGFHYSSDTDVWATWTNKTRYTGQPGFVFVLGMLNGAYSVGNPDCSTHLAEEIPNPSRNIPKAVLAQMATGFLTGVLYMIAVFYSIHDIQAVYDSIYGFPLAEIYYQATGSRGGGLGLLIVAFIPTVVTCAGCYITAGRTLWTISRDRATPFSGWLSKVSSHMHNPFNATLTTGVLVTILACIYVGSTTAFNAFVGCYVQLSSLSYFAAIFPHLLTRRKTFTPGPFWMGRVGFFVNTCASIYIPAFIVIFCFPYVMPVTAQNMNYASLMTGGLSLFVLVWWFIRQGSYEGPKNIPLTDKALISDAK